MENKNLHNFNMFLKEHKDVQEELKKEMSKHKGAEETEILAKYVEFGAKHGFEFTVEDLQSSYAESREDLSDEELGKINGASVLIEDKSVYLFFTVDTLYTAVPHPSCAK